MSLQRSYPTMIDLFLLEWIRSMYVWLKGTLYISTLKSTETYLLSHCISRYLHKILTDETMSLANMQACNHFYHAEAI